MDEEQHEYALVADLHAGMHLPHEVAARDRRIIELEARLDESRLTHELRSKGEAAAVRDTVNRSRHLRAV